MAMDLSQNGYGICKFCPQLETLSRVGEFRARAKGERDNFLWNLEWCRDHHQYEVKFDSLYMASCSQ